MGKFFGRTDFKILWYTIDGDHNEEIKIYLDTSVISFYFAEDAPKRWRLPGSFDRELVKGKYEIYYQL